MLTFGSQVAEPDLKPFPTMNAHSFLEALLDQRLLRSSHYSDSVITASFLEG